MNQNKEAKNISWNTLSLVSFFFPIQDEYQDSYQRFLFSMLSRLSRTTSRKSGNGIFQFSLASVGTLKEAGTWGPGWYPSGCWVMLGLEGFC